MAAKPVNYHIVISDDFAEIEQRVKESPPPKINKTNKHLPTSTIKKTIDNFTIHKPAPYKETFCIEKNPDVNSKRLLEIISSIICLKTCQEISIYLFLISLYIYLRHAFQHRQMVKVFFLDFYISIGCCFYCPR